MKKNFKILSFALLFVFVFVSVVSAAGIGLSIDGLVKSDNLDINEGRTLLAGSLLENMGFDVEKEGNKATVKNEEVTFEFTLDTNKVRVNDIELTLEAKSYEKNGEVYLPLRFVFETLGYNISWDGENKRVAANKMEDITYPITIEDNGVEYVVDKEPETIVSLAPSVTEIVFALGAGDKLKGRTQYCNYPEQASEIQTVGNMTDPSIEAIIDIYPDIVMGTSFTKQEILNKVNEAGMEVVIQSTPNYINEMYEYTLKLGAILNKNYVARALVSSMKSKVGTVEMKLNDITYKPTAYFVVGTGQWGEYTAGSDTFISEIIKIAGGQNTADDVTGWKYSLEKLIDNDPEIIFGGQFNIDSMKSGENYQVLSAMQNDSVIVVNEDIFSRPSPRLINEGLKILLEMFHEDIANDLNF